MKKIFNKLKEIEAKNYYYRLIVTPEHIDVKIYSKEALDSKEHNYSVKNTSFERVGLLMSIELFYQSL